MPTSYFTLWSQNDRRCIIQESWIAGDFMGWNSGVQNQDNVAYPALGTAVNGPYPNAFSVNPQNAIREWDFQDLIVIDEITLYYGSTNSFGTWKAQGSNDNSTWTDIGASFVLTPSAGVPNPSYVVTSINGNTTPYRYYRIIGVSGTCTNADYSRGVIFQCDPDKIPATSYLYVGGEGDRRPYIAISASGTVWPPSAGKLTDLIDGIVAASYQGNSQAVITSAEKLNITWDGPVRITGAYFITSDSTSGVWKWQGSNDNISWTDLGSSFTFVSVFWGSFVGGFGNVMMYKVQMPMVNSYAWQYYRLIGVSGSIGATHIIEMNFQVGTGVPGPNPPPLVVACNTPPQDGIVGTPYLQTLLITSGTAPFTCTITGGALPPGLSMATDGVISGTPTLAGTYNWTATVVDSVGLIGTVSCTIVIDNAPPPPGGTAAYMY